MVLELSIQQKQLGLPLIRNLEPKRFGQLSDRILSKLPISDAKSLFSSEEKEKLQSAFQLDSARQLNSILDFTLELWNQIAFYVIKPAKLATELQSIDIPEAHAEVCAEIWGLKCTEVIDRLKYYSTTASQLKDVHWSVHADVAGSYRQKINEPVAHFNLGIQRGSKQEQLVFGGNEDELYSVFQKLESVQGQIDSLMS